jgi:hypothetical protein
LYPEVHGALFTVPASMHYTRSADGETPMRHKIPVYLSLVCTLVAVLSPAGAHHSVSGQFDRNKRVALSGVITKIDWINPHTYLHLDVRDENGSVTTWQLESLPTAMLRKAGITSEMLRGGGVLVTVDAILAHDDTLRLGWLLRIDYPDGHSYQLASAD